MRHSRRLAASKHKPQDFRRDTLVPQQATFARPMMQRTEAGFPLNRGDFVMRILFLLPVLP